MRLTHSELLGLKRAGKLVQNEVYHTERGIFTGVNRNTVSTYLALPIVGGSGDLLSTNNLSDLANAATARTNLGLGTLATQSGTFSGTSSGTNTGDQTSIVGISGTKAEFDTACSDGNFLYTGDVLAFKTIVVSGQSDVVADSLTDTLTLVAGSNITITTNAGTDTITIAASGGGGLSDTDYGDITVSGGGTAMTIDNDVVDNVRLANMASQTIKGRASALTGDPEDLTASQVKTILSLNNVENTALSTWAGSTNITTLGTIGSGTWNGGVIGSTYGGTGVNNAGRTLTIGSNSGGITFTNLGAILTVNGAGGSVTGTNTGDQDLSGYLTIASAASTYQPLDSDLTTIAGLTATTDNFIVSVASAWASRTPTQVKTTLALNNVENTALSTWVGSTNITTLGTIATGTWNATVIADGKIAAALTGKSINGVTLTTGGLASQFLDGTGAYSTPSSSGGGDIVYAPTPADVAINSITDITIATKDLTGIAAGDQIVMEGEFVILNNSAATRIYVITLDFDNAFDIEITTPALATSATLMHPFMFRAVCNIRSTSLAYTVVSVDMQLAAGIASGGDTTMAATHLSGKGWGETASNLTGTLTCNLKIRSANAAATQTCRLVNFIIRKTVPVP